MQSDILFIEHNEYGSEQFRVSAARCNIYQTENGVWEFVVCALTDTALHRSKDLADLVQAEPWLEATAVLSAPELSLQAGQTIIQAQGYDYQREENLSDFYYFSHESIENLKLELLEVTPVFIDLKLTGTASVSGRDATISLRTKFQRNESLRRSFN